MDNKEIIDRLIRYKIILGDHFNVTAMYLFGSFARGQAREYSDIDVAIVVDKLEGDYFDYTPKIWRLKRQIDPRIEPILFEEGNDPSGFLETIKKEGIRI